MSKADELRILRGARSIDAPKQYHHRTGDSEGDGGSMLDRYIQVEESYFEDEEEAAKAAFLKGFQGYLEKVFEGKERIFLRRLMKGQGKPHEIGRALGVDWFECLQAIQRKAFENTEPLERLAALTGWSRAEEFTEGILRKISKYAGGGSDYAQANRNKLRESLKAEGVERQEERKNAIKAKDGKYRATHAEQIREQMKAYNAAHAEQIREQRKRWRKENPEKAAAQDKRYREAHREEINARNRAYRAAHREEDNARNREYKAANRERLNADRRAYYFVNKEKEKEKEHKRYAENREARISQKKVYYEAHREKIAAYRAAYRAAHREEINAKNRARRAAEKAAKLAALAEGGEV